MLVDLLKKRRSIRKYKDKKVDQETINKIIESALYAPSARGRDNWEFIILDDKEAINIASYAKSDSDSFISTASHIVIVLTDKEDSKQTYPEDAAICGILMQLQASELGIGSCWIQLRDRKKPSGQATEEYLRENFNIPKNLEPVLMMTFGYPDEDKGEKEAQSFEKKQHFNKYGNKRED